MAGDGSDAVMSTAVDGPFGELQRLRSARVDELEPVTTSVSFD
jgi:hypothetical protein